MRHLTARRLEFRGRERKQSFGRPCLSVVAPAAMMGTMNRLLGWRRIGSAPAPLCGVLSFLTLCACSAAPAQNPGIILAGGNGGSAGTSSAVGGTGAGMGGAQVSGGGGGGAGGGSAGTSAGSGGGAVSGGGGAGSGGAPSAHYYVAPNGTSSTCSMASPCSITQAQTTVRAVAANMQGDLVVELADGVYRLEMPLVFTAADSGTGGHTITWQAASGAHPVISGAKKITGFTVSDTGKNIWKAVAPGSYATRQLFVDGKIAVRARQTVDRSKLTFTDNGFSFANANVDTLNRLAHPERADLHAVGSFTDRYSPVQSIANGTATMVQPAWRNNNWGYDTIKSSFRPSSVWVENALELLDEAGEWYLDTAAGTLYYKPLSNQDMTTADVELPQLGALVVVAGTYEQPAHDLAFRGITFSHTSWVGPNSTDGYACQQTGSYIHGSDYAEFEATRPKWYQMPAAVQVSAAKNIAFDRDRFVAIGQVGLGIGNDDNAHLKGLGLGVDTVSVTGSVFTQIAAGAIAVGGIQANAHHPSDPAMVNQNMTISNNLIHDVAIDYRDGAAILFTYTKNVVVSHNEIYDIPYSGIASGFGWGANDKGGSNDYETRGLYKYQPRYDTATVAQDNKIEANLLHDGMKQMNDGGCHYHLSASPGTVVTLNYCKGPWPASSFGDYEDEGSRYVTITKNIFSGWTSWGTANGSASNNTGDLTVTNNWVSGTAGFRGNNNVIMNNTTITGALPADAQAVADAAGLEPAYADLKQNP